MWSHLLSIRSTYSSFRRIHLCRNFLEQSFRKMLPSFRNLLLGCRPGEGKGQFFITAGEKSCGALGTAGHPVYGRGEERHRRIHANKSDNPLALLLVKEHCNGAEKLFLKGTELNMGQFLSKREPRWEPSFGTLSWIQTMIRSGFRSRRQTHSTIHSWRRVPLRQRNLRCRQRPFLRRFLAVFRHPCPMRCFRSELPSTLPGSRVCYAIVTGGNWSLRPENR